MSTTAFEEMKSVFEEFKVQNDKLQAEIQTQGTATQEQKNLVEQLNNRLDEIETKLNRPAFGSNPTEIKDDAHKESSFCWFEKYCIRKRLHTRSEKMVNKQFFVES
jgi:predicted phage gp36 major capsid-like protein